MKTLTLLNEKGGTGKTTVAITAAAGLAARNYRVLIIDADAQGHATRALGLPKYPGLYDLLVRDAEFGTVLRPIPADRYGHEGDTTLYVLGSNVETRNIATSISDAWLLAERLQPLARMFDVCIVDTAPTPSLLHGSIYLATDHLIYPTLCEFWSFDGLAESMSHRHAVKQYRDVPIAGVVPVRVRSNTLEHSENLDRLREQFRGLVWTPIPERIVWAEASTYQVPVFVHDPGSDAAGHAWELVDRMEELINGE